MEHLCLIGEGGRNELSDLNSHAATEAGPVLTTGTTCA